MPSSTHLSRGIVALALVVGALRGTKNFLPMLVVGNTAVEPRSVWLLVTGATVFLLVLDPVALFALGYLWGRRADVAAAYLRVTGLVTLAGFVGFVLSFVLVAVTVPDANGMGLLSIALVTSVNGLQAAIRLALAVIAGGAFAYFRSDARYRPAST